MGCGGGKAKKPSDDEEALKAAQRSAPEVSEEARALFEELFPKADEEQTLLMRGRAAAGQGLESAFADRASELHPGREALELSGVGCVCKKGLKPESPNQDNFCVAHADGLSLFAVFDGHGPYGDRVSAFAQDYLLRALVRTHGLEDDDEEEPLRRAFPDTHRALCGDPGLDCRLSGTTATLVVHSAHESVLRVAHVGDSRAVLCRKEGKKLVAEALTEDHTPASSSEKRRIQNSEHGEIKQLKGDKQERVFVKEKIYPGLTMTRSLGDVVGGQAGVTCDPEVKSLKKGDRGTKESWQFLLVCSDGVWQVMDAQEAADIIGKHAATSAQRAAENLAAEAWNRWIQAEENVADDITVVCYFFENPLRTAAEKAEKAKAKAKAKAKSKSKSKR